MEAHAAIRTGKLIDLSMQQLVDCVNNSNHCGGNGGCIGGITQLAYNHIQVAGGIATEFQYPYVSGHGPLDRPSIQKCHFNSSRTKTPPVVAIDGYRVLPANSIADIMWALVHAGPLAVNVDANDWHAYDKGIYDKAYHDNVTNINIDHGQSRVRWSES